MRLVEQFPAEDGSGPEIRPLARTADRDLRFATWFAGEVEDALQARAEAEREWRDGLRRYEAIPRQKIRDTPVENAPNIEVALGAIAADSIQAQFIDTIVNIQPVVTARPSRDDKGLVRSVAALQRRIDHGTAGEWNFRPTLDTVVLDVVQLGTGGIHIPHVEYVRKTDIHRVKESGPRMEAWPLEDILVPGGARTDIQLLDWIGLRAWYTAGQLDLYARRAGWDIDGFQETGSYEWVRSQRETLGRHRTTRHLSRLFEVIHAYVHYDYDEDGEEEDLYAVYDRASRRFGLIRYNPYETRPIEAARYQLRAYLFYGQGVLEMTKPGQAIVTELMNAALLNTQLLNVGVIAVGQNTDDQQKLWSGKLVRVTDPTNDFMPKQLAVPSGAQTAQMIAQNMSLVERRVGVNDMSMPRPSAVLGSRTPGITAMSMLQQVNKRFTPAFDQVRLMMAAAVRQCLFREQERLLAGDRELEQYLMRLLGPEDGQMVVDLLRDPNFDESLTVELTASSASVNREADRQSALLLVNVLGQYYGKAMELIQFAANPQVPPPVREVARKIADAASAIIERTIRTFDIARDPSTFVVDMDKELDELATQLDPAVMAQLAQLTGAGGAPGMPMQPGGMGADPNAGALPSPEPMPTA